MAASEIESRKCLLSYVNGHELVTNNSTGSERKHLLICGFGRDPAFLIPTAVSGLCFKFYYDDFHDDVRVNTIDMGLESILRHKLVFKDTKYREMLIEWSRETGIPLNHLTVYNYTKRENKTMRPNTAITVDLGEESGRDGPYTSYQIGNHLIPTNPTLERIQSIHHRIGNVLEEKRSYLLFDERQITTLIDSESENYDRIILVALKYFDILEQKMYFVDWLKVEIGSMTFADIAKHIESVIIPNNKWNGGCLHSLYDQYAKMCEFEAKSGDRKESKFIFFEEQGAGLNSAIDGEPLFVTQRWDTTNSMEALFNNGAIFVFQINPFHSYFFTLKQQKMKKDEQNMIGDRHLQNKRLPMYFQTMKLEYEKMAEYCLIWYETADQFIKSQVCMTNIEITIRENMGWKHWAKALTADRPLSSNITRSIHTWKMDENTTFGMIRKRLGSYYNIKPEHFEIWLPQRSLQHQWNYGNSGRGQWDKPLRAVIRHRSEWRQLCPLQFEIQPYNVRDFDQMTEYHTRSFFINGSPTEFSSRIQNLAIFNVRFYLPSYPTMPATSRGMTVIYRKDWTAKDFIQSILNQIIENPVFLHAYFGHIIEYIRENEMEDQSVGDTEIIRNLSPNRFVIVDEEKKPQTDYHMDDEYKMPDNYSQIKYTDFRVHFLAKNDPLVLIDVQNEVRTESEHKGDEQMARQRRRVSGHRHQIRKRHMVFGYTSCVCPITSLRTKSEW